MAPLPAPSGLEDLKPDCGACAALCCVAPAFDKGDDFALNKPALTPCRHLTDGNLCKIHEDLVDLGFPACESFDCLGAGQYVTQNLYGRDTWRTTPELLPEMAEAFRTLRRIHEALQQMFLAAALPLSPAQEAARQTTIAALTPATGWTAARLAQAESDGIFAQVRDTLTGFRSAVSR